MLDNKFRSAAVWGFCFITICIFILAIPTINTLTSSFTIRLLALVLPLSLYAATLIAHLHGYVYLGNKYDSKLLSRSSQLIMVGLGIFMFLVVCSILANIWLSQIEVKYANAGIGLLVSLMSIPAVLFAVAIIRMYRQFGISTIIVASIAPVAVITMWRPWPMALIVGVSVYLLYRASKM